MTEREFQEVRKAAAEKIRRTSFAAPVRRDTSVPASSAVRGASRH